MPRIRLPNPFRQTSKSWTLGKDSHCPNDNDKNGGYPSPLSLPGSHEEDSANWEKFKLLLWKNYKIQIRHKLQTLMEVTLPILFTAIVVVVRCIIESKVVDSPVLFPAFSVDEIPLTPKLCCDQIFYSPNNSLVKELMGRIHTDFFEKTDFNAKFIGFATEEEMVEKYMSSVTSIVTSGSNNSTRSQIDTFDTITDPATTIMPFTFMMGGDEESDDEDPNSSPVLAGIVFTNDFNEDGTLPNKIKYKLRFPATPRASSDLFGDRFGIKKIWYTETLYPVVQLMGPRAADEITGGVPGYSEEGFLYLQYAIDSSLAKTISGNESLLDAYNIMLKRFPYPSYLDDKFLYTLQGVLPLTLILSFIFPVINITKLVLVEKERRLKEYMSMMGLPNWLHWTAWFIKSILFLSISAVVITILLKIRVTESQILEILPKSDPTLIFVGLMTHIFQLISFAFFISTLFKTANSAAIVAGILWFIFFIPFAFLQPRYNVMSRSKKIGWSFATNIGICFCCQLFCIFEGTGLGAQWKTVFQGATPDDTFCLADCMMIMVVNGLFYLALTIYVEGIWPGEYGIPLPWYFPFTKWYWTGDVRVIRPESLSNPEPKSTPNKIEYFETANTTNKPGIRVKGLTKQFDTKVAVKGLTLDMYENEVFVCLGHNGAGKTSTMSMLAGIFPPTSGTAIINGFDICKNMKAVRRSLGLCPQSNVLFQELTVEEHLRFYSVLKGLDRGQVEAEVQRMTKAIGLLDKKGIVASALSGGMKRKLSVGIAFCAQSSVILLDEPSSGLDPGARRSIWDLIQNEKKGRTILLSTHYMDEAEILGDRIGIMAEGELQCCGSPFFLKKRYGCGYHLVIVKEPACKVEAIADILVSKLGDIEQQQNVGAELSYALPENKSHLFAKVFQELESRKEELKIASYGASLTTMEEVFVKVGQLLHQRDSELSKGTSTPVVAKSDASIDIHEKRSSRPPKKNTGLCLKMQQLWAMICKKVIFNRRRVGLLVGQLAICTIYPSLVLLVLTTIPGLYDPVPHPIFISDYESFGNTTTIYQCPDTNSTCQGMKSFLNKAVKKTEEVPTNESMPDALLEMATKDIIYFSFKYFIGYQEEMNQTTGKTDLIGLFNNQPLHTPPLALNFISNAILTSISPKNSSYQVEVTNHPFGYGANFEELGSYFTIGFQVGLHFSLALGFMVAIYTVFPIKERALGSKHLQFVSGVNFLIFWIANFLVDLAFYFLPCLAIHLILLLFRVQDFYSVTVQLYLLLLFYCYAFAVLPMMYLSSLFFRIPSSGLVGMGVLNVLTGYATLFVSNILGNPELEKDHLSTILHRIFMIVPTYSLGKGITQISLNYQVGQACETGYLDTLCSEPPDPKSYLYWCCEKLKPNYLDWEELGIGKNLVYLTVFGTVFWILLLLTDSGICSNNFCRLKNILQRMRQKMSHISVEARSVHTEDEDVRMERKRIENSELSQVCKSDNLVMQNLTKVYSNGTVAVDRLSLGVKKGECFGLLGVNGAGKTSLFRMITGDLSLTSGAAFISGNCIATELQTAHQNMGYCPQFDALVDEMTGRETLRMYARLRGIPEKDIEKAVTELAEDLLFTEFLDRVVKSYSGGNKRKLSTAVALMGNAGSGVLFLDEPTSGIDPVARRHLWDCIVRVRDAGTSVVLTSHSMEETEILCTRLAIMVNGKFRCLGSPQQLKNKFGEGYTLTAQTSFTDETCTEDPCPTRRRRNSSLSSSNMNLSLTQSNPRIAELQSFIEASLSGSTLEDIHQGFLHYRVQSKLVTWAQLFTVMEAAKEKFKLEAYSVGQTSLEQVFLNFIRAQVNSSES